MKFPTYRVVAFVVLSVAALGSLSSEGQDIAKPTKRLDFMRQKLELSKGVLEGLAKEDYNQILQNAKKLKSLSSAAEWEVPNIPHIEEYHPFTVDFQRIADDLMKNAKDQNLDGATLAFTRMTMNCVSCHKYVRLITK